MNDSTMSQIIKGVAEEADGTRDEPYPKQTDARRRQRGVVMSVRLSEQEHTALTDAADEAGLPPSTLVRSLIQEYLTARLAPQAISRSSVTITSHISDPTPARVTKATRSSGYFVRRREAV